MVIQGWIPPMKTLIVYTSVHHQNTEKVAKVMAEEAGSRPCPDHGGTTRHARGI